MLALTIWFIYERIFTTKNLLEIGDYFESHLFDTSRLWMFVFSLILMLFNWGVEAVKWRLLILKIENISIAQSFKAILSGVTVSVFTPNRIGEYAGRVVYIHNADRIKAALITVITSLSQLIITLLLGSLALLFYLIDYHGDIIGDLSIYIGVQLYIVFFVLSLLVFLNTSVISLILSKIKFLADRFKKYIDVFAYYSQLELAQTLLLSLIRYLIFSIQYYLLLRFFDVDITIAQALILIPVYFITLTAIPSITLAELGIREVVAITVFSVVAENELGMVSTSFVIWLINLALPALIGMIFVLRAKLFKE